VLLRFEVANHRSIYKPVELSLVAVDRDRLSTWEFDAFEEQILSVAGLYGPNASGKSNVIEALAWLAQAVSRSLRAWDQYIPRDPFRFADGPATPTTFELELVLQDVRYTYHLELTDTEVVFEALYSYPERRRRLLFERDGAHLSFRRGTASGGIKELLTPTTLLLSAAMRLEDPLLRDFARAVAGFRVLGVASRKDLRYSFGSFGASTERLFDDPQMTLFDDPESAQNRGRLSALALLRFADLGIGDVEVTDDMDTEDPEGGPSGARFGRRHLRLVHNAMGQELPFDIRDESVGTRTWFRLIGPTLDALNGGRLLVFDEIDASLHPRLSSRLVELFQDKQTNRNGAQLIFTSHDTSLLNHLNRDEVWLTEKGRDGATTLTALADYGGDRVRKSMNIERAYLQGRFGAVPELDQTLVYEAMGIRPRQVLPEQGD
jgi:uncharacterized protein